MNAKSPISNSVSKVSFLSDGQRCVADFYQPAGEGPFPLIIQAHGLGGVKTMRLGAFAERFVAEGYACLVFDYRHFGESEGQPRQLLNIDKQLQDWQAAIDHAHTLSNVDKAKIAIWGTSFGGGHVLSAAAKDKRVAAVISQCPFTNGAASSMTLSPWISLKLSTRAIIDKVGSFIGAKPVMVALAANPGETALMNAHDAMSGYQALKPAGENIPNYVAARFALDIVRYYPGRKAKEIEAPVLFCICENDTVAPSGPTFKYAAQAPKGVVKRYADGHFDIYVGEAFERVVKDQIAFLQQHLPV